jgi:hypothetical protein
MPRALRSPASAAEPGKTNYVAVVGEKSMMIPPKDKDKDNTKNPLGASFADVVDGLSNTVMVVEASDEKAVIWTKPDDFTPDAMRIISGLPGLYPQGFNAALGDGSVHFIHEGIDADMLKRLFQRDDGEMVEIP